VLERGVLRGREQEWNISRAELDVLVALNLLTPAELEQAIATQYDRARIGFGGEAEVWVKDVLNIGVDPVFLLATLKAKFISLGGRVLEQTAFEGAIVHPNGVSIQASEGLSARLLIDTMGYFSPIVQQIRQGQKPDSVCLVVGSCAQGFPPSDTGDLFVTFTPLQNQCQYFWEAFPARDGRTTYLFTYLDAHPDRPSLEELFAEYLRLLPDYQGVAIEQLTFRRALFGCFPGYQQPLRVPWARVLPVGDSSGSQSPLSFGGFGAMMRHLNRLSQGIDEALRADLLDRSALALLQPYQPNLAVTWLFQRAMSVRINQVVPPDRINALLAAVFGEMSQLGDAVLKPFLQDVVQFPALTQTLLKTALRHPDRVLPIIPQVGVPLLASWLVHYLSLGLYSGLDSIGQAIEPRLTALPATAQYYAHRWLDAWHYGAGSDYFD
jgi:lycopene cyclase CruP